MSAPHPEGLGARLAMQGALAAAALEPSDIDYINLHGTGTASNDSAEACAVNSVFGSSAVPCSSTKGATGHTLGAAGALEAVICALALRHRLVPGGANTRAARFGSECSLCHRERRRAALPCAQQLVWFRRHELRAHPGARGLTRLSPPSTLYAYIEGIGLLGPGLDSWPSAVPVLADAAPYMSRATLLPDAAALPSAERRRAGRVVKLALAVGFEAAAHADEKPADLASVFASSGADGHNCHEICQVLATDERQLSPTRFHNSVHNAAAGYWSIASEAMTPANVLGAFDASFAAGLLEALSLVSVDRKKALLVVYDTEYPQPLHAKRPIPDAFGVGLVLAPAPSGRSLAKLAAELRRNTERSPERPAPGGAALLDSGRTEPATIASPCVSRSRAGHR